MNNRTVSTKTLLTLIAPAALVLATAAAALAFAPEEALAQAANGYPLVSLAAVLLLSWRLQRSRLCIAAFVLALASILLEPPLLGGSSNVAAVVAAAVPLGLALLAITMDRPLGAPLVPVQLALALAPGTLLGAALVLQPAESARLLGARLFADPAALGYVSQPALLGGALALLVTGFLAARRQRPADAGLSWTVLAAILAFASPTGSVARDLWILAAGLVLVIALVEASYAMAFHDELTALPGRRALNQLLASLRAPYTIAVIDVDRFKSFNDRYGHDVGDQVLRMVASRLAAVGGGGRPFRSGGEEFTIVFPGRTKKEALPHVQAVRAAVENARFTLRTLPRPRGKNAAAARGVRNAGGRQLGVTISAGLASFTTSTATVHAVVKSADKAMYRAKRTGRNRVVA